MTKAALGASGLASVCKQEEAPVLWMFYLKRELPQRSGDHCSQVAPSVATGRTLGRRAHGGPHFLPAPRGSARSLKDTDLPTRGKDRGTWVDPGTIAPECASERTLSPSRLHCTFATPRGDGGSALLPFHLLRFALSATRRQTGLPKESSLPQDSASAAGQMRSRRPSPSWLLPSSPSLARTGKRDRVRKKPKGSELPLEHTDQTLLARKVLHVLKKKVKWDNV